MPKFVFQLEPVLTVRQRTEQLVQQELAAATARKQACADLLAETRRLINETLEGNTKGGLDRTMGLCLEYYRDYLDQSNARQVQALLRHEKEVDQQRHSLVKARQARLVLERLKEKQYQEYRVQQASREAKELDDVGTRAFQSRRSVKGGD